MLMSIFSRKEKPAPEKSAPVVAAGAISGVTPSTIPGAISGVAPSQNALAELALRTIKDGIIIINSAGVVHVINPAAVAMTGCGTTENALGLDWGLIVKIESRDGRTLEATANPLVQAIQVGQPLEAYVCNLIVQGSNKRVPVSMSVIPVAESGSYIFSFRNIEKELAEESEKSEFISTASHEMRTPVASIEGYLSLAINPQTATIDERARGYLTSAHAASQHLGKLFRDLLDTTKLEDGRIRPNLVPMEMTSNIKQIVGDYAVRASESGINLSFGEKNPANVGTVNLPQVIYGFVDPDFLREIMDNLLDNAIKYTPKGGSVAVGIKADADRILISVSDSGIGISPEDLEHIFQKFYRADNSDTRTIGGTGLGLYLAKRRVEAMGGRIWAESVYSKGTTFYVSLPRLSAEEYEKRMIAINNNMNGGK